MAKMALSLCCFPSQNDSFPRPRLLSPPPGRIPRKLTLVRKEFRVVCASMSCSPPKPVRSLHLDKHVVQDSKLLFVQKLKMLILSHPQRRVPVRILHKYRSYLSLSDSTCPVGSMIRRYPSVFRLVKIRGPLDTRPEMCVCFTPAASALAARECDLQVANSGKLAVKLQKLLMLSSHRRLLLSKLVHLAPDLGLPPNFRSTLCNYHPDKFRTIETSYGKTLELVSWDAQLAFPLPIPDPSLGRITQRPSKFKQLKLRKGFNVKRSHEAFLVRFREKPPVCPYKSSAKELRKVSVEAEKRACGVVREVLGMTLTKRTLIDHLAIFRKDFGLPNNLRGMILRHPELFYVSCKGLRDSVFLVECFNDDGVLLEKDETLVIHKQLASLASKSEKMRQSRSKGGLQNNAVNDSADDNRDGFDLRGYDGLEDVIESEDDTFVNGFVYFDASVSSETEGSPREPW